MTSSNTPSLSTLPKSIAIGNSKFPVTGLASFATSGQYDDQSHLSSFSKHTPGKINIFPVNKLATAIAWHEESIREENEYAENDEGILVS